MTFFAFRDNKKYYIFLLFSALFSIILAFISTAKYGAAVSGDGVIYLSVADNLVAGKGFVDHTNSPLIWFPPFYPIFLALLKIITKADILWVGTYFQIFLLGLNIILAGIIFQFSFPDKTAYKYLGILFIITSENFLQQHIGIITEPIFITFTYLFIISAGFYLDDRGWGVLPIMTLTAALSFLTRWVGLGLILLGGILILWKRRKTLSLFLREGLLFGFFSSLPFALWVLVHNIAQHHTLWGAAGIDSDVALNLKLSLIRMLHWFLPLYPAENPIIGHPYIILGIIIIPILLINKKENWKKWIAHLQNSYMLSSLLFGAIYFSAILFTIATQDHVHILSTRYYPLLLLPLLLFLFASIEELILPHLLNKAKVWQIAGIVFLLLWALYPIRSIYKYVQTARKAEFSWTSKAYQELNWNSTGYRESQILAELGALSQKNPDLVIYSNYTDPVWLITRNSVRMLPTASVVLSEEEKIDKHKNWSQTDSGYIAWFLPNAFDHVLDIETLKKIADIKLVMRDESGELYKIAGQE